MSRSRLEAFSDGVIAVVITIMVLSLEPPHGAGVHDPRPLLPKLSVYLLSFVFVTIYWNNHHHLMQVVDHITGMALWANAHLAAYVVAIATAVRPVAFDRPLHRRGARLVRTRPTGGTCSDHGFARPSGLIVPAGPCLNRHALDLLPS